MRARYYRIGTLLYPSVTTVLSIFRKPGLEKWRGRLGNEEADRISEEARRFGAGVHEALHTFLTTGRVVEEYERAVRALEVWLSSRGAVPVLTEELVVSHDYKYAGRTDLVIRVAGALYVVDIKTTDYVAPEYPLQVAAYQQALREAGIDTAGGYILCFSKAAPGRISEHFVSGVIERPVFLAIRQIFDYFAPIMFTETEIVGGDAEEN